MFYNYRLTKVTHQYLERTKSRRYEKAIPPEVDAGKPDPASIDTFGFGVLADELLRGRSDGKHDYFLGFVLCCT